MDFKQRVKNMFVVTDQWWNALGGGNVDTTISGRIHYNCINSPDESMFWQVCNAIVDDSFFYLDGYDHCYQAYNNDPGEIYEDARFFDKCILLTGIVVGCAGIWLTVNPYLFLTGKGYRYR